MNEMAPIEVIALKSFMRATKKLLNSSDIINLGDMLRDDPKRGAIIRGTGGIRKMRFALAGKGKSGGARIIYYYTSAKGQIFLITAYAKNKKEDLTGAQTNALKKLVNTLEEG